MKNYHLIISILAVIGIAFILQEYPLIASLASFGVGLAYPFIIPGKKKEETKRKDQVDNDVIDWDV